MRSCFSWSGTSICRCALLFVGACIPIGMSTAELRASISYTSPGTNITQDFDSLPNTPTNTSLISSGKEWQDDTSTPAAGYVSIPGWYLYHVTDPGGTTPENGFNSHQRFRITTGNNGTGAFYSFGSASATDRALGSIGSANVG